MTFVCVSPVMNKSPVAWTTVSTQTVPLSGIIAFPDSSPPGAQAFYRAITP